MPRRFKKATAEKRIESSRKRQLRSSSKWYDPFPNVHGTLPEKMVYAELSRLQIPFLFLNDLRFKIPEIDFDQWYQADFAIPSLKIIIEVQGAYWHSLEKTVESDAFKFAIYETAGWKVLAWWDYEILTHLHELIAREPALLAVARPGKIGDGSELPVQRRTKIDTSKGIRTINARRKVQKSPNSKRRSIRKATKTRFV